MNPKAVFSFFALLAIFSCSDITEQQMTYGGVLYRVSMETLSITDSIVGIDGARSMILYPGSVFIATTRGTVMHFDAETMALVDEYTVGGPSAAGYSSFVSSGSRAYLLGAMGEIKQLSLPSCEVIDEFSVCPSPVEIELTFGDRDYLWVRDGSNSIYQVDTSDNHCAGSVGITSILTILQMEGSEYYENRLAVVTSGDIFRVRAEGTGSILCRAENGTDVNRVVSLPYDSTFVAIKESYSSSIGNLNIYDENTYEPGQEPPKYYWSKPLASALIWRIEDCWDNQSVVAIGGTTYESSTLYRYTYDAPTTIMEKEIRGTPLDMRTSNSGYAYILVLCE